MSDSKKSVIVRNYTFDGAEICGKKPKSSKVDILKEFRNG